MLTNDTKDIHINIYLNYIYKCLFLICPFHFSNNNLSLPSTSVTPSFHGHSLDSFIWAMTVPTYSSSNIHHPPSTAMLDKNNLIHTDSHLFMQKLWPFAADSWWHLKTLHYTASYFIGLNMMNQDCNKQPLETCQGFPNFRDGWMKKCFSRLIWMKYLIAGNPYCYKI